LKDGKLQFPFRIGGTIDNPLFSKGKGDKDVDAVPKSSVTGTRGTSLHAGANPPTKTCLDGAQSTPSLVVVVLVPIALLVPAVLVFIPPLMALSPATLPHIV
jgi:hypothetical protein